MVTEAAVYKRVTAAAYHELIAQHCRSTPIDPRKFEFADEQTLLVSIQEYAAFAQIEPEKLLAGGKVRDGYIVHNAVPGLDLILYDQTVYGPRARFTIMHEIGHSRLHHRERGRKQEMEADLFASQMLAPIVLLDAIRARGCRLGTPLLISVFGLSRAAAQIKMEQLRHFSDFPKIGCEAALLSQFQEYMRICWTPRRAIDVLEDSPCGRMEKF